MFLNSLWQKPIYARVDISGFSLTNYPCFCVRDYDPFNCTGTAIVPEMEWCYKFASSAEDGLENCVGVFSTHGISDCPCARVILQFIIFVLHLKVLDLVQIKSVSS